MKYLYIGAGIDVQPIKVLGKYGDVFIYVDSCPKSTEGSLVYFNQNGENIYSNHDFLNYLFKNLTLNNFKLKPESEIYIKSTDIYTRHTCLIFYNHIRDITLYYHINISIPEQICRIQPDLHNLNAIIVSSHFPNISLIMNSLIREKRFIQFVGIYPNTYQNYRPNTLIYDIENNKLVRNRFNKFSFINLNEKPASFVKHYKNWHDFISSLS